VPESSWYDMTQYSDVGVQEEVSVNLTDSNLWLVDDSQLNFQDSSQPPIVLPGQGQLYASPVQTSAVTTSDVTLSEVGGSYMPESTLKTTTLPVETGGDVTFSGINGEIDSDRANLSSSPSGASITIIQMTESGGFALPTNPDSPFVSTAYPNSNPPETSSSTTTESPEPLFPTTSSVVSVPGLTPGTPPSTPFSETTSGTSVTSTTPIEAVPVPFDAHTSVGLLIFIILFAKKLYRRYTPMHTPLKRDRNPISNRLEIIPE
jgi:hypothetical protein